MFDSTMSTMVGLIPIAMTAGIVTGIAKQSLAIPEQMNNRRVQVEDDVMSRRAKRKRKMPEIREQDNILSRIYGSPIR